MTKREAQATRNQERSLAAFLAKKAEFDALLAELQQASDEHFGADPDAVLWGRRWRLFFLATEGLFGHAKGEEWAVSHYRLKAA